MLLDNSIAAEVHTSWTVQLAWQRVNINNHNGNESLSNLLYQLSNAEQEDVDEENDPIWFRPRVRKKKIVRKGSSTMFISTDDFHDPGKDFSSVGLRGIGPGNFGWGDWGNPSNNESVGFRYMQTALVDHYAWFRRARPGRAWLRS